MAAPQAFAQGAPQAFAQGRWTSDDGRPPADRSAASAAVAQQARPADDAEPEARPAATPDAKEPPSRKPSAADLIPRGPDEEPADPSAQIDPDGKAETSMFGLSGKGFRFAYVLDRSASMGGGGRIALRAVKEELKKSLARLDRIHQFQIVFYNERPAVFNPAGEPGKLAFATRETKQRAIRFIDSISPDGGTNHEDSLRLALRLHPDVIFFLTDGDDPQLTRPQLDELRRRATGTIIHTIEFGVGPKPKAKNFLATLAEENGGKHVYVDLARYRPDGDRE